jgi:hypothetical protein
MRLSYKVDIPPPGGEKSLARVVGIGCVSSAVMRNIAEHSPRASAAGPTLATFAAGGHTTPA